VNDHRKGLLFVALAALLWSTGGLGIKAIDDSPLTVSFYRSLFAAVTLFLFFRREVFNVFRFRSSAAFGVAMASYAVCLTTFVFATKWTTAANAIFIQYAGVVWVLLLSPIVLHEPLRRRDVIAVAVALGGMALFFVGRFEARGMAGNLMALVSSVFFAFMILALRRDHASARTAVTWGNVLLAVILLPVVHDDLAVSGRSLAVLVFLGVFQIGFAYAAFVKGLRNVTATEASLTGMIEPVANPIWVLLAIGERPSVFAIAGGMIVLSAIAWHTIVGEPVTELPAPD
jgi:drug/metabolite transporter (DMT)-like permease